MRPFKAWMVINQSKVIYLHKKHTKEQLKEYVDEDNCRVFRVEVREIPEDTEILKLACRGDKRNYGNKM